MKAFLWSRTLRCSPIHAFSSKTTSTKVVPRIQHHRTPTLLVNVVFNGVLRGFSRPRHGFRTCSSDIVGCRLHAVNRSPLARGPQPCLWFWSRYLGTPPCACRGLQVGSPTLSAVLLFGSWAASGLSTGCRGATLGAHHSAHSAHGQPMGCLWAQKCTKLPMGSLRAQQCPWAAHRKCQWWALRGQPMDRQRVPYNRQCTPNNRLGFLLWKGHYDGKNPNANPNPNPPSPHDTC